MDVDVMSKVVEKEIKCLDKGFVKLVDCMPRIVDSDKPTADYAIVQAARVSYGDGTKTVNEDRGLIRYLMRHEHTTPFEMVEFKFHMKMPIFVARQIVRHRMVSLNEVSGRYSVLKDEFYFPELSEVKQQSKTNKQGGDESIDVNIATDFIEKLNEISDSGYKAYQEYLAKNVGREQARMIMPVNLYTEWYWKIDLKNLLHFIALRSDSHAQYETRVFSDALLKLIEPIVPFSIEAWNDYHSHRGAVKFTRLELDALKKFMESIKDTNVPQIDTQNVREKLEWAAKIEKLGLKVATE